MVATLAISWPVAIMGTLFVLTCIFMMLVILIQKPKGGGLSGAFGGAGGSAQAAFGAKTGDLLTMITIGCFVLFLGLAMGLVYAIRDDVTPRTTPPPPVVVPATTGPATGGASDEEIAVPEVSTESDFGGGLGGLGTETAPTDSAPANDAEPDAQP